MATDALTRSLDQFAMRWVEAMNDLNQSVKIEPDGGLLVGGPLCDLDSGDATQFLELCQQVKVVAGGREAIKRYVRLYPHYVYADGTIVG